MKKNANDMCGKCAAFLSRGNDYKFCPYCGIEFSTDPPQLNPLEDPTPTPKGGRMKSPKQRMFDDMMNDLYPHCGIINHYWQLFVYQFYYFAYRKEIISYYKTGKSDGQG